MLIGRTPLLELKNLEKHLELKAKLIAKLEFFNPAGSVKDRVAKQMIEDAEKEGRLNADSVIIEPTSGNTGIGLALMAAIKGLRAIIVMPDNMSKERITLMRAYGADVVLTDGKDGMAGAIDRANELLKETPNSILAGQFENFSNPKAHFETTGPEIYEDTNGNVDIFVCGVGTGGTISGAGEYLKSKNSGIKIVGVEPEGSPYLTSRAKGPHKIQGIGAGFLPKVLNTDIYDEILTVKDDDAYRYAALVPKTDGILVGISSGAALSGAIQLAQREENFGKNIVVLLPDSGSRYLSGDLFQ